MQDALQQIGECSSVAHLWRIMSRFCRDHGFESGTYYLLCTFSNNPAVIPLTYGFSTEVVRTYAKFDFQRVDIAPRRCIELGRPVSWREIWQDAVLTPEEREFFETMHKVLPGPGLSIPCYGPHNRNAYIALSDFAPDIDLSVDHLRVIQFVSQAGHTRFCKLFEEETSSRPLSARETEILNWVAVGKSNSVIADILGISSGTVDTYMRRIYTKFDVNDRTSAAVKGVGLGLIAA